MRRLVYLGIETRRELQERSSRIETAARGSQTPAMKEIAGARAATEKATAAAVRAATVGLVVLRVGRGAQEAMVGVGEAKVVTVAATVGLEEQMAGRGVQAATVEGGQVMVAIMTHSGYNQEDSILFNEHAATLI